MGISFEAYRYHHPFKVPSNRGFIFRLKDQSYGFRANCSNHANPTATGPELPITTRIPAQAEKGREKQGL
jgi:hypothetical protein